MKHFEAICKIAPALNRARSEKELVMVDLGLNSKKQVLLVTRAKLLQKRNRISKMVAVVSGELSLDLRRRDQGLRRVRVGEGFVTF